MRRTRSITTRLSLVFLSLFGLVILLELFSIVSLNYFNGVSSQVQQRWLPSTRVLGDLNNFTSDFRAADGAALLAGSAGDVAAREKEMADLDRSIATAQRGYLQIAHEPAESALYARFAAQWEEYRRVVEEVRFLYRSGASAAAAHLYNTKSKSSYDAASDTLGQLTDRNVASAREAGVRTQMALRRARWLTGITIVLTGLAVAGAMTYVRLSISSPILALTERMHRLATHEMNIDIQGTTRSDEIGEMARAVVVFRDNAVELMASRRGLEQQASMLTEKLAEERRLMLLQRNFVSMASHEFRTPLTIIDAHAQRLIAMKDRLGADALVERAGKIRSAVLRITYLIDNLIDTARVMDGEVKLYFHPAALDLALLLREVCQLQREIAPFAAILERVDGQPVLIIGDRNLLFQLFGNLLSNAIKYSPGGGAIRVTLTPGDSRVAVCVEDHGIGIPEADRDRIFERYHRGSNAAGVVGTGIGLYFAKIVAELHGGDIRVESHEGKGSRFTVQLPIPMTPDEGRPSSPGSSARG